MHMLSVFSMVFDLKKGKLWAGCFSPFPLVIAGHKETKEKVSNRQYVSVKVYVMYGITPHQRDPVVASKLLLLVFKYVRKNVPVLIGCVLFPPVHPLNVVLVVCFQLLALQFECVSDQTCLWRPGLGTQADFLGDLKALKFCWLGDSRINTIGIFALHKI